MKRLLSFLKQHEKFLYCGCAFAIAAFALSRRFAETKGGGYGNYASAIEALQKWEEAPDDGEAEKNLQDILATNPLLQRRYEGRIGQNFLIGSLPERGRPYIERVLTRVEQPHYSSYARTSMAISEGRYAQALEEALALKEEMVGEMEGTPFQKAGDGSLLFACNLMRIAHLYGQIDDIKAELESWRAFEEFIRVEAPRSKECEELLAHFTAGECSLLDYIQERRREGDDQSDDSSSPTSSPTTSMTSPLSSRESAL